MILIQSRLFLLRSLVAVLHFLLLISETSSLSPEEKHADSNPAPVDARLVGGDSRCSGRLEMKHQGEWRFMALERRDARDKVRYAEVACRQMGCGSVVSMAHNTNNTEQQQQPAWEVRFYCTGAESTLSECNRGTRRERVHSTQESALSLEVICSESLKLVGSECEGRVSVRSDQSWIQVCEDGFDPSVEKVICKELGCGPPRSARWSGVGLDEGPVVAKQFQCKGNESRLEDCASSIRADCKPARRISCGLHEMRLVGGQNRCEGTVEIKYVSEWRPLTHGWNYLKQEQLSEVCAQVGCAGLISVSRNRLPASQPMWALSSHCDHDGSSSCESWDEHHTSSSMTITCSEYVRIINGSSRCSGYLEVKSGQSWLPVCSSFFTAEDALVICRELECGFPNDYFGRMSIDFSKRENVWDPIFTCNGTEKRLVDCPTTRLNATKEGLSECSRAHLTCAVRPPCPTMAIYSPQAETRRNIYKGHRFAITCTTSTRYSVRSVHLTSFANTKRETKQIQSPVDGEAVFTFPAAEDFHRGSYSCDYNYNFRSEVFSQPADVFLTVKDPDYGRLVNGNSRCAGSLEVKYQKEWRPVSYQHSWSLKEAAVLCRQLNCGSTVSTRKISNSVNALPAWRFSSDCDGSERALMDCGTVMKWHSSSTVEVVCSDVLLPPKVAVFSMRVQSDDQKQEVLLHRGHSFTVSCSVEPQYPGGHFSIVHPNQTHSHTRPAVNHSANFTFTGLDEAHRGDYSCVYHNFVFNHNFTSESQSISVNFADVEEMILDDGVLREDDSVTCAGKLLVSWEDQWRLLSAESTVWDLKHASVVCRYLGCGAAVSTTKTNLGKKELMLRFYSDCDGSETSLLDCGSADLWFSSSAVEVVCTGHQSAAGKN